METSGTKRDRGFWGVTFFFGETIPLTICVSQKDEEWWVLFKQWDVANPCVSPFPLIGRINHHLKLLNDRKRADWHKMAAILLHYTLLSPCKMFWRGCCWGRELYSRPPAQLHIHHSPTPMNAGSRLGNQAAGQLRCLSESWVHLAIYRHFPGDLWISPSLHKVCRALASIKQLCANPLSISIFDTSCSSKSLPWYQGWESIPKCVCESWKLDVQLCWPRLRM